MYAKEIPCAGKYRWLIHHHPMLHLAAKVFGADGYKITEPINNLSICPAPFFFQYLRQIPVINSYPRLNTLFMAVINYLMVMVYAGLVNFACAVWQNARPGN